MEQIVEPSKLKNIKKERFTNIEILRIIAMVMIIAHHFAVHGGFEFPTNELSLNVFWYDFMAMGGKIGVNIFVLISGFFLINSTNNSNYIKKILKLLGQILFYSLIIYFLILIFTNAHFSFDAFMHSLFPITYNQYWFASTYLVLYIFHPILNMLLKKLDKIKYQMILLLLFILWCLIMTFTNTAYQSNDLLWFIFLYSLAGYIRLYDLNPKLKCKGYLWLFVGFLVLTLVICIVLTILGRKIPSLASPTSYMFHMQKLPAFLVSLTLFMTFSKLKIRNITWINIISSATFGVYLIHDNSRVRPLLWKTLFKNYSYQSSIILIPYSIGVILLVFVICTIIDLIRIYTFEKLYLFIIDKVINKTKKPINKMVNFSRQIIFGKDNNIE